MVLHTGTYFDGRSVEASCPTSKKGLRAVEDGGDDDENFTAITALVNDSAGNYPLIIPPGGKVYEIYGSLPLLKSNLTIINMGSILKCTLPNAQVSNTYGIKSPSGSTQSNIYWKNLWLRGNHDGTPWGPTAGYGRHMDGVFGVHVDGIKIDGLITEYWAGIGFGWQDLQNFEFNNIVSRFNGRDGNTFWALDGNLRNGTINGIKSLLNGDDGLVFYASAGNRGTSCTVSNTSGTLTVTAGTAPTSSNLNQRVYVRDMNSGGDDYEGIIATIVGATSFTVYPTPTADITGKECWFDIDKPRNITVNNYIHEGHKQSYGDTGSGNRDLGRGLVLSGCNGVVVNGFSIDTPYASGVLCTADGDNNLVRNKNCVVANGTIRGCGNYNSDAGETFDGIRNSGEGNIFANITMTDVRGSPWVDASSYTSNGGAPVKSSVYYNGVAV